MQLPYLGKSQNTKNDQFRCKQHIVLWITTLNDILFTHKFFQSKYLLDRLITDAQNVEVSTLVLKKIQRAGTIDRQQDSGRPRSVCVNENTENVEDLVTKNAPIELWDHMWNWHSVTDYTK